jgi:hypothetical protein
MGFDLWARPKTAEHTEEGGEPKALEKTPAELIAESLGVALKPLMDKMGEQDARFTKLEEQTRPRETKSPVTQGEPTSVLDDENLAFAQRLTPLLARQFELESRIVRNDIKTEYHGAGYGELWSQFEAEINSILDAAPLVTTEGKPFRGDPQYVRNVVDMIMGRAAKKAGMRFDGKSKGFFLEPAGGHANDSAAPTADGMTDGQRKVFARMGVPKEKAAEVIKKLHFVS